jgi:hypothetical protein
MTRPDASVIDRLIDIARGSAQVSAEERENRDTKRVAFSGSVALVQVTATGDRTRPLIVRCKNISPGGLCIVSRQMLHIGHGGAVMMQRSNGTTVLLGARVVHCSYIGNMEHESGIEFTPLPEGISERDFHDAQGNLVRLPLEKAA